MTAIHPHPHVRPYAAGDRAAVFDICMRTADAGGDARHLYQDHELLPNIFAAPYTHLAPDLAFVLDDGSGRAVGYVVGTADTVRFVKEFREVWLPSVAERHPAAADPWGPDATPDQMMAGLLHTPERMLVEDVAAYPAHLHIDLLPQFQGRGHGRALMARIFAGFRAAGAPAVHVGMVTANTAARPFYDRLGFHPIPVADPGPLTYLGRSVEGL